MVKLSRILIITLIIAGCSTVDKAKLNTDNPKEAISELQYLQDESLGNQIDLLAHKEYRNGEQSLSNAVKKFKNNEEKNEILNELAESKAYFLKAKTVANSRNNVPLRILSARKATLQNGILESNELKEELSEVDDSLRDSTNNFNQVLPVETLSEFEKDYLKLEVNSVQNSKLMVFRDLVKNAKRNKAEKLAQKTYRNAFNDVKAAENMIQQNPRNPENYKKEILTANKSTKLLSDVMGKLTGVAKGASENAALKLVSQERKLGLLSDRTTSLQGSLNRSQRELMYVTGALASKSDEASRAERKVRLQAAIDNVRTDFSKDEAEVYQQGNDIIIRLKQIDFKSGSSMVPSKSMNLLSRVNDAIEKLHSSNVMVQGHTDSTGRRGNNQLLSVKRSNAVAKYLDSLDSHYNISSNGFGESHPIANNQTKEGREINRRVDLVVSLNEKI